MDGRSIVPLLIDSDDESVPEETRNHVKELAPKGQEAYISNWRDSAFIEHYYVSDNEKCNGYKTEDLHNNFIGIRHMADSEFGDSSYAEYQSGNLNKEEINFDNVDFVEYFKLSEDPWQMKNLWKK